LAVSRFGYDCLIVTQNMVTADDVVNGKPSPEPYIKGAALLGVAPSDCLVFEDTPAGVAAARAAGMQVVALGNTYPAHELQAADARVNSLLDVSTKIRQGTVAIELADMNVTKNGLDG
ncbi:MAG TPA: HAD-IA family hydrolase, partial [Candidatus Angelobacter sp.]|nr:HAD-IA family hydrolase [Candidatus Angelobacter sp.]